MKKGRSGIVVLLVAATMGMGSAAGAARTKQDTTVQVVKLTVGDTGYVVTPSTVTRGVPVRMEADLTTVRGCAKTVVISAFDVKKTVTDGDATIEFTPVKAGEIGIACGMDMIHGTFTVVERGERRAPTE